MKEVLLPRDQTPTSKRFNSDQIDQIAERKGINSISHSHDGQGVGGPFLHRFVVVLSFLMN